MSGTAKRCIFCQLPKKMTNEHIWGDWTKDYVERTSNKHDHAQVYVPKPCEPEPADIRIRAGDPLNSQVHVVCADCNSGWMSRIQKAAKPILVPLFDGKACTLSESDQVIISAWIAMATMTSEYLSRDKRRIAVTQTDRKWLMDCQSAPSGWCIWIGRYKRQNWPTQWVKASFPVLNTDDLPDVVSDDDRRPTLQTTAFTIGQLFAFSMSSHFPEIPPGWDWRTAPRARDLLRRIWPPTGWAIKWPPNSLTDTDGQSFGQAVIKYFDDLAVRKGYR